MVDIPSVPNILQLTIVAVDATGRVLEQDDLTDQYINCVLKQNLFSPEIDLLITLSESKGSLTRFNKVGYQGQELVFLKFTNSLDEAQDNLISMQFWVERVSGVEIDQSKQSSAFNLHCVSKEGLINGIQGVNQSFNSTYTDAIRKIFRNYIFEPSKSYYRKLQNNNQWTLPLLKEIPESPSDITNKFIVPGLNPFKAIQFCARRNYELYGEEKYKGASWTFFADWNHRYRFENLEHLIKKGKEDAIDLYMSALPDPNNVNPESKIKEFNKLQPLDNRYNTFEGVYHNKVTAIDYYGKRWKNTNFNIIGNENEFQQLGKRVALDKDWLDTFVKDSQHSQLFFKDTTKFNAPASQNYENILTKRRYFYSNLYNTRCEVILEGRNDISVGQVVNIDMPEASAAEDEPTRAETKFSGYLLVDNVTHSWSQTEHNTKLSLLKDTPTNVG